MREQQQIKSRPTSASSSGHTAENQPANKPFETLKRRSFGGSSNTGYKNPKWISNDRFDQESQDVDRYRKEIMRLREEERKQLLLLRKSSLQMYMANWEVEKWQNQLELSKTQLEEDSVI